jgi:hypothetical protein
MCGYQALCAVPDKTGAGVFWLIGQSAGLPSEEIIFGALNAEPILVSDECVTPKSFGSIQNCLTIFTIDRNICFSPLESHKPTGINAYTSLIIDLKTYGETQGRWYFRDGPKYAALHYKAVRFPNISDGNANIRILCREPTTLPASTSVEQGKPYNVKFGGFKLNHRVSLFMGSGSHFLAVEDRFSSLAKHPFGRVGGASSVAQGAPNKKKPRERQEYGSPGCKKHKLCPPGHILLGFQIAYFIIFGALALGGAFLSYQIADRGLDLIERGREMFGSSLFLLALILAPTFTGVLPAFGFWLTFESGRVYLLDLLG